MTSVNGLFLRRAALAVCIVAATVSRAADYTWLNEPASGSWNDSDANWSGAGPVWVNAPTNNALFGGSQTTAIAVAAIAASNLTFMADGYVLDGGSLNVHGNISVGPGQTASITTPLAHPATNLVLVKYGDGTLALNPGGGAGSNLFASLKAAAGTVHVTGGTNVVTLLGGHPESSPAFWVSGGTFVMGGGLLRTTGNLYARVSEYGALLVTNGYLDLKNNTELLNGHNTPGVTTVAGTGILDVNGLRISQNAYAPELTAVNINLGGTLRIGNFGLDSASLRKGTVNFDGGTVVARWNTDDFLGSGHTNWLDGISAKILAGGAVIDTDGRNLSIKHPLVSGTENDGGLVKKGTGTLTLRGTNTYVGGTVILGGALGLVHDNNLGAVPASPATNLIFAVSASLISSNNNELAANRTLLISTNAVATFDTQGCTQTVNGVIVGDTGSWLRKYGPGMLTLNPGAERTNSVSTLRNEGGVLRITSGTHLVTTNSVENQYKLYEMFYITGGGTVVMGGGLLKTISEGWVTISGGTLLITNGTVNISSVRELLNAYGTAGNTTVGGNGVLDLKSLRIAHAGGSPDANVVNVNTGGTIRLMRFYIDQNGVQKGRVNLNGGTLVAKDSRGDFMGNAHINWYGGIFFTVREGGAVIDSNGFTIDSKQPFYSGAASDGGLTKRGAGTFTLSNTNTYNGVTRIEGGRLTLGLNNALPPTNTVRVSSNAVFDVNGKVQALAGLGGGGTVTNLAALTVTGTLTPGDAAAFGTLTLAAPPASMAGCTLAVNVSSNGACGRLHLQGDLNLSALSLNVEDTGLLDDAQSYTVATCTGTLSNTFAASNLPTRWLIRYDTAARRVYLIYNRGTVMLMR